MAKNPRSQKNPKKPKVENIQRNLVKNTIKT